MENVHAIFATGIEKEFSKNGVMPWGRCPLAYDANYFVKQTAGGVVVMGHNTWDSLPNKLKGRVNVVLASKTSHVEPKRGGAPDYIMYGELETVLIELATIHLDKPIWVIGGKAILEQVINKKLVETIHWTRSDASYEDCEKLEFDTKGYKVYATTRVNNYGFNLGENLNIYLLKQG